MSDINTSSWYLENVEERAREHPRTFFIPPPDRRHHLREGDTVKLVFVLTSPSNDDPGAERMWVDVLGQKEERYLGKLLNQPNAIADLQPGAVVTFGPQHVAAIAVSESEVGYRVGDRATVSRRLASKDERPGVIWRNETVRQGDSGWTLMLGDESDSFSDDAKNFGATDLGFLTDKFPELEEVFREGKVGDEWRWDDQAGEYRRTTNDQS